METFMAIANFIVAVVLIYVAFVVVCFIVVFISFLIFFGVKDTLGLVKRDYHLEFGEAYDTEMIEKEDKENE